MESNMRRTFELGNGLYDLQDLKDDRPQKIW